MTDEIRSDEPIEEPYPGDPREAQEPQEPRTTHVDPHESESYGAEAKGEEKRGAVDDLRETWDRLRGK